MHKKKSGTKVFSSAAIAASLLLLTTLQSPAHVEAKSRSASSDAESCQQLLNKQVKGATIKEAERLASGASLGYGPFGVVGGRIDAAVDLCRVRISASPVAESNIEIEVWLPDNWNGKMLGMGGGGFNGGLGGGKKELAVEIARGYAGVINDAGHEFSASAEWALNAPEAVIDFGSRANKVAAVIGKEVVAAYYGQSPSQSYFHGCSNGGRDALMLAQRHPTVYDGIIAGAPANNWTGLMSSGVWNSQRSRRTPEAESFRGKLQLLNKAVIAACDSLDGVEDGVLENPLACSFDPAEIQCEPGDEQATCLTGAEVDIAREVYRGPSTAEGEKIIAGHAFGSEADWDFFLAENGIAATMLANQFFRWFVYHDADWSPTSFELDRDYALAKSRVGEALDAMDPDLTAFTKQGGKLILYSGWWDVATPTKNIVDYYAAVQSTMESAAVDSVQMFLMPGVGHCAGGPGPSVVDWLTELDRWVESGSAPERIVASKYENDGLAREDKSIDLVRTRPLCAWPKTAHYRGAGSTDVAENFTCKVPR